VAASLIAAIVATGQPASAETVAPPVPKNVQISQGMSLVGIDEGVARKAGFEVMYDETGTAIGVKRPGEDFAAFGYSRLPGNCGYSEIMFNGAGNSSAFLWTAFYTNDANISFYWKVDIIDSRGASVQTWSDVNFDHDWEGERWLGNLGKGSAFAAVNTISHAILWWGGICVSAGPSTTTTIW
jgi:hypothetical protein